MVVLNSTSGAKTANVNWFGSHITVPFSTAKIVKAKIVLAAADIQSIQYTIDGGSNWRTIGPSLSSTSTNLVNKEICDFGVYLSSGQNFNIRATSNVTVTSCDVYIDPIGIDRFAFSESRTTNLVLYYAIAGNQALGGNATESKRRLIVTKDFAITRLRANVDTNGKNGATVLAVRDDAADAATLSINALATGEQDSGALAVLGLGGSEVALKSDTSLSSDANSFSLAVATVEIEYL